MAAKVAVLGAGSWGTALAVHLGRLGHDVRLWARDRSFADEMSSRCANAIYLPDITFPASLSVTAAIDRAVDGAALIICAVPSHGARAVVRLAAPHMADRAIVVSAAKGLEADTHLRVSEIIAQEVGPSHPVVVLSGPSFAPEVAQQLPTAVLAASLDSQATAIVQAEFRGPQFRCAHLVNRRFRHGRSRRLRFEFGKQADPECRAPNAAAQPVAAPGVVTDLQDAVVKGPAFAGGHREERCERRMDEVQPDVGADAAHGGRAEQTLEPRIRLEEDPGVIHDRGRDAAQFLEFRCDHSHANLLPGLRANGRYYR